MNIITPITREEAEQHVTAINNSAADMGRRLLDLKEREGWKVLGYATWTDLLDGEFSYSRKHLYELMKATPVLEYLLPVGNKVSTKAAAALADYEPALQPTIIKTVQARYGEFTESNVNRVGRVVQEMATTGHVDTGNGTSTPIDAALDLEDHEALQRHQVYKEEAVAKKNNNLDPLMTSDSYEWYTPEHIARKAFDFLGGIELDPASSAAANAVIKAQRFFSVLDNGLEQSWAATAVWMNPPYGRELPLWIEKLASEYEAGHIMEALALVPARPDTAWFKRLRDYPRCFIDGRLKFGGTGTDNSAPFPSMLVYLGKRERDFVALWSSLGDIYVRVTL